MGKGFGQKADKQLGYILNLMPEFNAYAAKFSTDFRGQPGPFIGITSMLDQAQIWKKKQDAEAAVGIYLEFLENQLKENSEASVKIMRILRSEDGLKTESAKTLRYTADNLPS